MKSARLFDRTSAMEGRYVVKLLITDLIKISRK